MNTKRINNKLVELDSIKKTLNDAGVHHFYEIENKKLLIHSSDSGRITLEVKRLYHHLLEKHKHRDIHQERK